MQCGTLPGHYKYNNNYIYNKRAGTCRVTENGPGVTRGVLEEAAGNATAPERYAGRPVMWLKHTFGLPRRFSCFRALILPR